MADSADKLPTEQHVQELLQDDAQAQKPSPPPKELIATKVTGTVKWFNVKSGYGFINRNDTKEDVFVHQSAIAKNNPKKAVRSVGDGEVVEFDVVIGEKGNEAANVTGPSGEPVRGSQFAADKRRNYRPWMKKNRRKQGSGGSQLDQDEQGADDSGDLQHDGQDGQHQMPRQQRGYRRGGRGGGGRGGGGGGGGRRFNNYYPRNQSRRGLGGGDGGEGGGHDSQIIDGMPRGGDGQPMRRGGPQRRFFRRNYNNGPPVGGPRGGGPRNDDGAQGPPRNPRPRRNNRKPNMAGGDQHQQQNGGQDLQNTTTESNA